MNKTSLSLLIIDDEESARYGMRKALEKVGYVIHEAGSIETAEHTIERVEPEVIILDVKLGAESGLDFLPSVVSRPSAPLVIMVTAHGSERLAVEAIKKGAYNYLSKPFDLEDLRLQVHNAFETIRLRKENSALRERLAGEEKFGQLIGSSPAMKQVYAVIDKVAQTNASVLILGESGTGKELVAREIHARSDNRQGQFVALNCAAMPDQLVESELFGHEKGSFTGASHRRIGKFEVANHGTLFLDEIGDMNPGTQAKLLRVLEDRVFERVGSNESIFSDVRLISATNKDLEQEIKLQRFREDLYYRLCVVTIQIPPLRERKDDLLGLSQKFCSTYSLLYKKDVLRLSPDAVQVLLEYTWPGNVRQLKNSIERGVVLAEGQELTVNVLPAEITGKFKKEKENLQSDSAGSLLDLEFQEAKKEFERRYIKQCLERTSGNITQAAAMLGMHRQSLQHKLKELKIAKKFLLED